MFEHSSALPTTPGLAAFLEPWIDITALSGQDAEKVKAGRFSSQVPLADDGGLVARLTEQLGEGLLRPIERFGKLANTAQVIVFPR